MMNATTSPRRIRVVRYTDRVLILNKKAAPKGTAGRVLSRREQDYLRSAHVILDGVQMVYGDLECAAVIGIKHEDAESISVAGRLKARVAAFDCDVNARHFSIGATLIANGTVFATGGRNSSGVIHVTRVKCLDVQADVHSEWPQRLKVGGAVSILSGEELLAAYSDVRRAAEDAERQEALRRRKEQEGALLRRLKAAADLEEQVALLGELVRLAPCQHYTSEHERLQRSLERQLRVRELKVRLENSTDPLYRAGVLRTLAREQGFTDRKEYLAQHEGDVAYLETLLLGKLRAETSFSIKAALLKELMVSVPSKEKQYATQLENVLRVDRMKRQQQRNRARQHGRGRSVARSGKQ